MLRALTGLALAGLLPWTAVAQTQPVAPVREIVDDYHGTRVADPYRYLENVEDPSVQAWMRQQSDYTAATLRRIPGRAALLRRMEALDGSSTTSVSNLQWLSNGQLFYLKRSGADDAARLYTRDGVTGKETLLVDPDVLRRSTGKSNSIDYLAASPDGRHVAYGLSEGGSERSVLTILDVPTRTAIDRSIDRAQFANPTWSEDGRTLYYNRLRLLPEDAADAERQQKSGVYAHVLGTDPDGDELVFDSTFPGVEVEPTDIPYLIVIPGSGQAFGIVAPGAVTPQFAAYVAPLTALRGRQTPWRKLFGMDDKVSRFDVRGDELFLVTFKNTSKHEVLRTSLARPDLAKADRIVPASNATLGDIAVARDALYLEASAGGVGKVLRVPYRHGSRPEVVRLPLAGTVVLVGYHPEMDGVLFALAGWTRAPAIYRYDPRTRNVTDTRLRPAGRYGAPADLVSVEVEVASHDGTLVPLSIVHKRGLRRDGRNPTLLQGYGAYGFSTSPNFTPRDLAWYERGGILAFAHVRGGGEYGEDWHLAGFQKTKPNTWRDFIACAEYLIAKRYTSKSRLAGVGTSAGGILVGRALTERPDLFTAGISRVGLLDLLRFEGTTNGAPNVAEFGSVKTEEGYRALREMSAYHHVADGTAYPAVLLIHGLNDARVDVWSSTKMAARLQAATSSGKPVLLRLDYDAGHGQGATVSQQRMERADVFAFILWQCRLEGFEPAASASPAASDPRGASR